MEQPPHPQPNLLDILFSLASRANALGIPRDDIRKALDWFFVLDLIERGYPKEAASDVIQKSVRWMQSTRSNAQESVNRILARVNQFAGRSPVSLVVEVIKLHGCPMPARDLPTAFSREFNIEITVDHAILICNEGMAQGLLALVTGPDVPPLSYIATDKHYIHDDPENTEQNKQRLARARSIARRAGDTVMYASDAFVGPTGFRYLSRMLSPHAPERPSLDVVGEYELPPTGPHYKDEAVVRAGILLMLYPSPGTKRPTAREIEDALVASSPSVKPLPTFSVFRTDDWQEMTEVAIPKRVFPVIERWMHHAEMISQGENKRRVRIAVASGTHPSVVDDE